MIDSIIKFITGAIGIVFHAVKYAVILLGLIVLIMIIV